MSEPIIPQVQATNHQEYNLKDEHWKLACYKGEAVFVEIKTFEMIMMIMEGFSYSKAAAEFGYTKSQLRKKILKLKLKHIQNTKVSVDILADSNLK